MKQSQINKAFPALKNLFKFKLPVKKAKAIYHTASNLETHFEFSVNEEMKYVEEFGGTVKPDGTVSFKDIGKYREFQKKIDEMYDLDVDIDIQPITLSETDIGDQAISPADIRDLDGIIIFE